MIPAITPITIPAIAPPLKPPDDECAVTGRVLPLAVAGAMNGWVVVAATTDVAVVTPPLVGRNGAEYVLVTVGAGAVYDHSEVAVSVHHPEPAHACVLAQQITPHDCCPRLGVHMAAAGATYTEVVAAASHEEVYVLVRRTRSVSV